MRRRKSNILTDLMVLPWWYSPLAALLIYLLVGYAMPSLLFSDRPALAGVKEALLQLAPILGLLLLVPTPFAYFNSRKKRGLVDTAKGLDSVRALSWREFEQLVAEAYRRQGYTVRENLSAGPDGGVDVSLEKDGQLHLVQCKQWKAQKVGVSVVREMFGLMTAKNAASLFLVTSGLFTQEAKNFAEGKPIDLVDGGQLSQMIVGLRRADTVQPQPESSVTYSQTGICPQCGSELVERVARKGENAGSRFLGCAGFPKCRYTRDVEHV